MSDAHKTNASLVETLDCYSYRYTVKLHFFWRSESFAVRGKDGHGLRRVQDSFFLSNI
jgi:hypothetical protein